MKNRLFYFFLLAAVCYGTAAKTQIKYTTQNYTHDLAPLKVSISLLNFENILTPVTAGVAVDGQVKDKLFYSVLFRQGYIRNVLIPKADLITTQKESKGTLFEAGADWVFRDTVKTGRVKVTTSSINDGTYIHEKYFIAACDVRKYWALSGGVAAYIRPKYMNSDSSQYIISGTTAIKAPEGKNAFFNQRSFGFYAGLSHRKIKKAIVNSDGYNYRRFYSTRFYLHALIGVTTTDDIIYNGETYQADNTKQMPLGYRIGWQWDEMGVITGLEFGKRPCVKLETPVEKSDIAKIFTDNPFLNYVNITFHFNIYNGDKNYHMKKK